jgi:hypothetical protein
MDQSIRLRRPEDGPSPYCAQSAHSLHSGPETVPDPLNSSRRGHEPSITIRRGGKVIRVPASQVNLPADGA